MVDLKSLHKTSPLETVKPVKLNRLNRKTLKRSIGNVLHLNMAYVFHSEMGSSTDSVVLKNSTSKN